jgi:hypothetical protein
MAKDDFLVLATFFVDDVGRRRGGPMIQVHRAKPGESVTECGLSRSDLRVLDLDETWDSAQFYMPCRKCGGGVAEL